MPAPRVPGADIPGLTFPGTGAEVRFTRRSDGDMSDPTGADPEVAARRDRVVSGPWTCVRQVHGAVVVRADRDAGPAAAADGLITSEHGRPIAILTADSAPIALAGAGGVLGAVHAGWRGLQAGVVEAAVDAMRAAGAIGVVAALGPCIHAECYRFGVADLAPLVARYGPQVRACDAAGAPALDLPATVRAALAGCGVTLAFDSDICTACSAEHWSWRARRDAARQAMVVWRP